jgi:RNA recognition motif-containing protein
MIVNHFKVYGEIGNHIIRIPDKDTLSTKLPEEKRNFILNHKYAFICYKNFDSATKAVNKVSYEKINNKEYNAELNSIVEALKKQNVLEPNLYKCACFIIENCENYKTSYGTESKLKEFIKNFEKNMADNDNNYIVKDKTDRMECCQ